MSDHPLSMEAIRKEVENYPIWKEITKADPYYEGSRVEGYIWQVFKNGTRKLGTFSNRQFTEKDMTEMDWKEKAYCLEIQVGEYRKKLEEAVKVIDNLNAAHELAADERNCLDMDKDELKTDLKELEARIDLQRDTQLLDFLENHKQYILGFAPSGDYSIFDLNTLATAYGKTVRLCLEQGMIMDKQLNG